MGNYPKFFCVLELLVCKKRQKAIIQAFERRAEYTRVVRISGVTWIVDAQRKARFSNWKWAPRYHGLWRIQVNL